MKEFETIFDKFLFPEMLVKNISMIKIFKAGVLISLK